MDDVNSKRKIHEDINNDFQQKLDTMQNQVSLSILFVQSRVSDRPQLAK